MKRLILGLLFFAFGSSIKAEDCPALCGEQYDQCAEKASKAGTFAALAACRDKERSCIDKCENCKNRCEENYDQCTEKAVRTRTDHLPCIRALSKCQQNCAQ